jgi:hypothetical protein
MQHTNLAAAALSLYRRGLRRRGIQSRGGVFKPALIDRSLWGYTNVQCAKLHLYLLPMPQDNARGQARVLSLPEPQQLEQVMWTL